MKPRSALSFEVQTDTRAVFSAKQEGMGEEEKAVYDVETANGIGLRRVQSEAQDMRHRDNSKIFTNRCDEKSPRSLTCHSAHKECDVRPAVQAE